MGNVVLKEVGGDDEGAADPGIGDFGSDEGSGCAVGNGEHRWS